MTLVFENDLVAPTLTLTIAYLILSIYASRRLIELHKAAPEMNTRKLFVMTCSLTTILRLMTFGRFVLLLSRMLCLETLSLFCMSRDGTSCQPLSGIVAFQFNTHLFTTERSSDLLVFVNLFLYDPYVRCSSFNFTA